tara:strand:- start:350 stop:568 length:219 start_codon:yes stop_codon:yes gene_type:complete
MKPKEFINCIRNNFNKNGTLKSIFVTHYLSKLNDEELQGFSKSLDVIISSRQQEIVDEKIVFLSSLGYKVTK